MTGLSAVHDSLHYPTRFYKISVDTIPSVDCVDWMNANRVSVRKRERTVTPMSVDIDYVLRCIDSIYKVCCDYCYLLGCNCQFIARRSALYVFFSGEFILFANILSKF